MIKRGLRMKELVERTGVPASAIRHYLAQGLLPKPKPIHKRLHLYPEETVERVQLIKRMQRTEHLPLDVIARRMKLINKGTDPDKAREIDAGLLGGSTRLARYDLKGLARRSGCHVRRLREAQRYGFLIPAAPGNDERRYDDEDLLLAKKLHLALEAGVDMELLGEVAEAARRLADTILTCEKDACPPEAQAEDRVAHSTQVLSLGRHIGHYVIDRAVQRAAQKQLA